MNPGVSSPSAGQNNWLAIDLFQFGTQKTSHRGDIKVFGKTLKGPAVIGNI
jgi:hypothetical protein